MKYNDPLKPRPAFIVLDEPCCLGCRQPIHAYHSDVCPLIVERSKVEAIEWVAAALMRIGGALEAQLEVRADRGVETASRGFVSFALMQNHTMQPGDVATPYRNDLNTAGIVRRLVVAVTDRGKNPPFLGFHGELMVDDFSVAGRKAIHPMHARPARLFSPDASEPLALDLPYEPGQTMRLQVTNESSCALDVSVVALIEVTS